jgi:hypothetical protein
MNDKLLREEYQTSLYDRLSLNQLWAAHNFGHILASIVLWNRGLINISTVRRMHPTANHLIISNAYRLQKERGY